MNHSDWCQLQTNFSAPLILVMPLGLCVEHPPPLPPPPPRRGEESHTLIGARHKHTNKITSLIYTSNALWALLATVWS